jgi:hypothetical protein
MAEVRDSISRSSTERKMMRYLASTGVDVQWNFHPNWVAIVIVIILIAAGIMFLKRRHGELVSTGTGEDGNPPVSGTG